MWVRFEHDLHSAPFNWKDEHVLGSRVVACRTLVDCCYRVQMSGAVNESLIDESKDIDATVHSLTLVVMVGVMAYRKYLTV